MTLVEQAKIIKFKLRGDERGHLVVAESGSEIPFDIKRLFYIFGTEQGAVRGRHANRKSKFVLIALAGSCKVRVDDGKNQKEFSLDNPDEGLYIPRMLWKDMYDFSPDCVLLSISSEPYDADEYIRDMDEYLRAVADGNIDQE